LLDVKEGVTWDIHMYIGSAVEGKIKMPVCLNKHSTSQACVEEEAFLHLFVILALDAGEWLTSCPCMFGPRKRADRTRWIGAQMLRSKDNTRLS
jgi:hypothetical protein